MEHREDAEMTAAIKAQASRYPAAPALRARLRTALHQAEQSFDASSRKLPRSWWPHWLGLGAAFAVGVIASFTLTYFHADTAQEERIASEIVAGHVRSLMAAHLADVASSDQHTVKPWFGGKLDFSPPVADLSQDGFPLLGGRLDYIHQRPVAVLVYRHHLHTINLFVWPTNGDSSDRAKSWSHQGYNVTKWRESGMQFWAVSDMSDSELQKFANLIRPPIAQALPG